jgi:zinc protease
MSWRVSVVFLGRMIGQPEHRCGDSRLQARPMQTATSGSLIAVLICVLGGAACSRQTSVASAPIAAEVLTLANGLRVILHRDATVPLVFIQACFQVSAADDPPGKTGLAHVVEHLVLRGTAAEESFDHGMATHGATDFDTTCYRQRLPAHELELGLWREARRMDGSVVVGEARMEAERRSVLQEIVERFESQGDHAERLALRQTLWPELAPWGYLPGGRKADVSLLTTSDAETFLRAWYVTDETAVVIAGDFDPGSIRTQVNRWLAGVPRRAPPTRAKLPWAAALTPGRLVVNRSSGGRQGITYLWRAPGPFQPAEPETLLLVRILGDGDRGRIASAFRTHGLPLAQAVTELAHEAGVGGFLITVRPGPGVALPQVGRVLDEVIERLRSVPVDAAEHAEALALIEARLSYDRDSLADRAHRFHLYSRYLGRPDGWAPDMERFQRTTRASLQSAARALLDRAHRAEVVFLPAERPDAGPP